VKSKKAAWDFAGVAPDPVVAKTASTNKRHTTAFVLLMLAGWCNLGQARLPLAAKKAVS